MFRKARHELLALRKSYRTRTVRLTEQRCVKRPSGAEPHPSLD